MAREKRIYLIKIDGKFQTFEGEFGICVYSNFKAVFKELKNLQKEKPKNNIIAESYELRSEFR